VAKTDTLEGGSGSEDPSMSESGQTWPSGAIRDISAYPPAAEFDGPSRDVSVVPRAAIPAV
jgi:hypothetical protein